MRSARITAIGASLLSALVVLLGGPSGAMAEHDPLPGTDLSPVLGYSTWSSLRLSVSTEKDEAEASALHEDGLQQLGYDYFNQDDGWYQCPGRQGPNVDARRTMGDRMHSCSRPARTVKTASLRSRATSTGSA